MSKVLVEKPKVWKMEPQKNLKRDKDVILEDTTQDVILNYF
jgi:hypothetical protein